MSKRSFIDMINHRPSAANEYLPKAIGEQPPDTDIANQNSAPVASQSAESWQASGKPTEHWQASLGKPDHGQASQDQTDLASQSSQKLASQKGYIRKSGRVALTVRYSPEIYQAIKEFCDQHNMPVQDFCEMAACQLLDVMASQSEPTLASRQTNNVASRLAHDDLKIIFKTCDDIINRYFDLTGRKWTAADDRAAGQFNTVDHRLIELGMINTYLQARGRRINSFKYFIPEIQDVINSHISPAYIDDYLKRRRELLAKARQGK